MLGSGSPAEIRLLEEINAKTQRRKDAKVVDLPQRSGCWKKLTFPRVTVPSDHSIEPVDQCVAEKIQE